MGNRRILGPGIFLQSALSGLVHCSDASSTNQRPIGSLLLKTSLTWMMWTLGFKILSIGCSVRLYWTNHLEVLVFLCSACKCTFNLSVIALQSLHIQEMWTFFTKIVRHKENYPAHCKCDGKILEFLFCFKSSCPHVSPKENTALAERRI